MLQHATAELTVVESCMYEYGDLNVPVWNDWQNKDDTVTDPKQAKYKLVLKPAYPDHMAARAEKMGERQKECMRWIDTKYHEVMDFARDHDIVKCSEAAKASIYQYYDMSYCFAKNDTVTLKRSISDFNQSEHLCVIGKRKAMERLCNSTPQSCLLIAL